MHSSWAAQHYQQLQEEADRVAVAGAAANVSAQRHLAASEQALQAARAGYDVRAERWHSNPRYPYEPAPLFDRPSGLRTPRSHPRHSRRSIGPHPIDELTRAPPSQLVTGSDQPLPSACRPPPVAVPYTPVASTAAPDVPLPSPELDEARSRAAAAARLALATARAAEEAAASSGLFEHKLAVVDAGRDPVRAAFERFDQNRSGRLDYRELREALRTLGIDATTADAARTLSAYDADGSGLMELDEFRRLVKQLGLHDDGCCDRCCPREGCCPTGRPRALLAAALCFVAGYAFALALHDERCASASRGGHGALEFWS